MKWREGIISIHLAELTNSFITNENIFYIESWYFAHFEAFLWMNKMYILGRTVLGNQDIITISQNTG